jgi:hypothetical protein
MAAGYLLTFTNIKDRSVQNLLELLSVTLKKNPNSIVGLRLAVAMRINKDLDIYT